MSNFRLAKPLNSWVGTMSSASGLNEAVRCIYDVQSTNLTDRRIENTRVVFFFLTRLETDKTVRRRTRFRFTAPAKHLQKKKKPIQQRMKNSQNLPWVWVHRSPQRKKYCRGPILAYWPPCELSAHEFLLKRNKPTKKKINK